ncbi:MAG: hypothetical protein JWM68_2040 [Verrucomicrobiales bacterium]|nr:hypothetical protein [Verrucomicrobiales bacterium]
MDAPTDPNPQQPVRKMRWLGFFMSIGGGVLAYFSIVLPLVAASHHEDDVSISLKAVMLAPALVILGLMLLFMGNDRAGRLMGSRQRPTPFGWVICIVIAGIGILLYEWLKSRLRAYGYSI